MRGLAIFALTAACFLSACGGDATRVVPIDQRELRALATVHVDPAAAATMLSAYRRTRGLGPVRLDPALTAIAQRQADAMAAANALSHNVAGNLAARLAAGGVNAREAGENIGGGYYSTEEAMSGWRNSPNIMLIFCCPTRRASASPWRKTRAQLTGLTGRWTLPPRLQAPANRR
jgi:Cysteine-rich secretory protein family